MRRLAPTLAKTWAHPPPCNRPTREPIGRENNEECHGRENYVKDHLHARRTYKQSFMCRLLGLQYGVREANPLVRNRKVPGRALTA